MEDKHRKLIQDNIDSLVNLTKFEELSQACFQYELLSPIMLQIIHNEEPRKTEEDWSEYNYKRECHKRLFLKITKRGPHAFEKLCCIFRVLNYDRALNILRPDDRMISISLSKQAGKPMTDREYRNLDNREKVDIDDRDSSTSQTSASNSGNDNLILHKYVGTIRPKKKVVVEMASHINRHPHIETYSMESKNNRGVFFMVNIIDFPLQPRRNGADEDAHSLLSLFKQLGFHLYAYTNITRDEFFKLLDKLLKSDEVKNTECFVMALMTHGQLLGKIQYIQFGDGAQVNIEEIEKHFYHKNCVNLVGKPKIFIYPYCRGEAPDYGVKIEGETQTESVSYNRTADNISQVSDIIKCYATTEGTAAIRDPEHGSWYIQAFVKAMAEHAFNTPFEDILKIVQIDVAKLRTETGRLQTCTYVNLAFKVLYFNPGI